MQLKLFIIVIVLLISVLIFGFIYTEKFEDIDYQKVEILKECENIKPTDLIELSGNVSNLKNALDSLGIPDEIIAEPKEYPRLASLLVKTGFIKCD